LYEEATAIWLPEEWITLAASSSSRELVQSPQVLRTHLTNRGQEDYWYVLSLKGHQANGKTITRRFLCVPGRQPEHFEQFRDVLATAAGRPGSRGIIDYTNAQVMPIPDELKDLDPQQAYDKLSSTKMIFP